MFLVTLTSAAYIIIATLGFFLDKEILRVQKYARVSLEMLYKNCKLLMFIEFMVTILSKNKFNHGSLKKKLIYLQPKVTPVSSDPCYYRCRL